MDVEKAKQVLAEDAERQFMQALDAFAMPVSVELIVYVDGIKAIRQSILLSADGTWRLNRAT